MATVKQDIELALRASDTTTKKTFGDAKAAVDALTASMEKQVEAAAKGEVSAADLKKTLDGLKQAGTELAREQGLIEGYAALAAKLAAAELRAKDAKEAFASLRAEQANAETVTTRQANALTKLENASTRADTAVNKAAARVGQYEIQLREAGIETNRLAETTSGIVAAAERAGAGIRAVSGTLEGYEERLALLRTESIAAAEAQEKLRAAADHRQFLEDAQYFHAFTIAVNEMRVAQEAARKEEALAEKTAAEHAIQLRNEAEALNEFYAVADKAVASSKGLQAFTAAEARTISETVSLRQSLSDLQAPVDQLFRTVDGAAEQITKASEEIGNADKPLRRYTDAIDSLVRGQRAVVQQAGLIDGFRAQAASVAAAEASYTEASAKLAQLAAAMRSADTPSKELTAELRAQESVVQRAGATLAKERTTLAELSATLQKAKIDVNDLSAAETRLRASAEIAAAAQNKIRAASGGHTGAFAFLGLEPNQLTNVGYQLNDVFTQLASGTPILQVLAQQGGQVAQIFPGLFAKIAGILPELTIAIAVFGTLGESLARIVGLRDSIREFTAVLDLSSDRSLFNANTLAHQSQALADLGVKLKDAREAIKAFVSVGIDPTKLGDFAQAARDVADVTGIKVPEAAKALAEGFSGGFEAIKKLDQQFNFLSVDENNRIRELFKSGQAEKARTEAFAIFTKNLDKAASDARGPWKDAFRNLGEAFANLFESIGSGIANSLLGKFLQDAIDKADQLSKLLPGVQIPGGGNSQFVKGLPTDKNGALNQGDIIDAAKTIVGEAGPGGDQAVAEVIRNRSIRSGQSIGDVVRAPGQFAGFNAQTQKLSDDDPRVVEAARTLMRVLLGAVKDQTGGATNFFTAGSPSAKRNPGQDIGGNTFRGGSFPGDRGLGGGDTVVDQTNAKINIGNDLLADRIRQDQLEERASEDANKIRIAGENAYSDSIEKGSNKEKAQANAAEARRHEQVAVDRLRARELAQLASQEASALQQIATEGDNNLTARLAAVEAKYKEHIDHLNAIKAQGGTKVNGIDTDKAIGIFQDAEASEKRQTEAKFYEEQLGDSQKTRASNLKEITDAYANSDISADEAAKRIAKLTQDGVKGFSDLRDKVHAFADALLKAKADPKLQAFVDSIDAAGGKDIAENNKASLDIQKNAVGDLVSQRDDALKSLTDQITTPGANIADTLRQAVKIQDEWNPKIVAAANAAKAVADNLNDAKSAANFGRIASEADSPDSKESGAAKVGAAGEAEATKALNEALAQRNQLVETATELAAKGEITEQVRVAATKNAYQQTQKAITDNIAALQDFYGAQLLANQITLTAYNADIAKLQQIQTQSQYVNQDFLKLRETIINAFQSSATTAINGAVDAISRGLGNTERWNHALADLARAGIGFFTDLTKQIAEAVIQTELLAGIKNFPGLNGLTTSLSNFTGIGAGGAGAASFNTGATALNTGATALNTGAATLSTAGVSLNSAAAALNTAAATLGASGGGSGGGGGILSLLGGGGGADADAADSADALAVHGGGIIGMPGGQRKRVNPLVFVGAPRYHSGGTVGLASDEQAAILRVGEKVSTEHQQRNDEARLAAAQNGGHAAQPIKQVLLFDERDIAGAMAGSHGEKVTLTHIKNNRQGVKSTLGG